MSRNFALGLAAAAIALMIGGPLLAHLLLIPSLTGLALFAASALLGLGALAAGAMAALRHRAYFHAMIGMLGCLPVIAVTAGVADSLRYPAINDITTDTTNPPAFAHAPTLPANAGRDLGFPVENGPIIAEYYPDLEPLTFNQPPDQVYRRARGVATSRDFAWTITADNEARHIFEAVAETRLFHWNDDVIVRVRPDGDGGSIVDVRSKSREGKSDLGANARRIRRFLEALSD